jgi:hypothetical protein
MTERKSVLAEIKRQTGGCKPILSSIDTEDLGVIDTVAIDIAMNPDKYTTVDIMGVPVKVKTKE